MLSFASAPGNLFNRWGKLGALIKNAQTYQTSQLASLTNLTTGATAQYAGEADIQAVIGAAYIGLLAGPEQSGTLSQSVAALTANRMVFRDNPQISQTLQSLNTITSLNEIIRQMKAVGASVLAMTITAAPTGFIGVGNGVLNFSTRRPLDGLVLENAFAENLLITCTSDSYSGSATAGNEGLSVTGTGKQADLFAFNWPLGSNARRSIRAIDGNTDNGNGNLLTGSGFNSWTGGLPSGWLCPIGSSLISQENSLVYDGASALKVTGDGSTLVQLTQEFNLSGAGGTVATLSPQTQYSFNIFARRDGVAAGAGQWVVDLIDGGGNVILDAVGNPNTTTIDLTALTTNYASFLASFRTPVIMPSRQLLRMRMPAANALTTGRSVYFDKASFGGMLQIYTGGPFGACHAGSIPFAIGDYANCLISNSRGAGGTLATFQTLLYQMFPQVASNELLFPSSATPTISDSLIG